MSSENKLLDEEALIDRVLQFPIVDRIYSRLKHREYTRAIPMSKFMEMHDTIHNTAYRRRARFESPPISDCLIEGVIRRFTEEITASVIATLPVVLAYPSTVHVIRALLFGHLPVSGLPDVILAYAPGDYPHVFRIVQNTVKHIGNIYLYLGQFSKGGKSMHTHLWKAYATLLSTHSGCDALRKQYPKMITKQQ